MFGAFQHQQPWWTTSDWYHKCDLMSLLKGTKALTFCSDNWILGYQIEIPPAVYNDFYCL